jgi:hypothetical protein
MRAAGAMSCSSASWYTAFSVAGEVDRRIDVREQAPYVFVRLFAAAQREDSA